MREVQIVIRDDFDGSTDAETVTFSAEGKHYEIDLGKQHLDEFREALAPYIEAARPAAPKQQKRQPSNSAEAPHIQRARDKIESGEPIPPYLQRTAELVRVRDWARANGYKVNNRARITDAVLNAYNHAHPDEPVESK